MLKNTFARRVVGAVLTGVMCLLLTGAAISQTKPPALNKENIEKALIEALAKFKDVSEGKNADYIPELAKVDSKIFGIALVTMDGKVYSTGDLESKVSIQSISKVFTLAKDIEELGPQAIKDKIGVDATGMRFNSIVAVELQKGKEINPLVNPGAIAASSLIKGNTYEEKWTNILTTHSDFAARQLDVNEPVYQSEAATNQRNQAIAQLLFAYDRMYFDPKQATDIYTKQCAINVNAKDLAVMASTLANGGFNPVSKKKVVSPETAARVLAVMATAGLYDDSGQWIYDIGLPGKSGVGGGIIAVSPGKFGIAVISPPLDAAGNSVKARMVIDYVANYFKVNQYLTTPKEK
jgi:glutaminase